MRAVVTVALVLGVALLLVCASLASAQMDACSDCEDPGPRGACWSADACYHKMPGWICEVGGEKGKCVDVNHASCVDEPQEVCCGCVIATWSRRSAGYVPAEGIPDGDPSGASWTITVEEPITFGFLDVGVDIAHAAMGELEIELSHEGLVVTLMTMPECEAALLSEKRLWFSDEGVGPIQATPDLCAELFPAFETLDGGPYVPAQLLEPFNFIDPMGEWTLTIRDMAPGRAVGELHGWELAFGDWPVTPTDEFSWGMVKALYR
jgi:hypothetical protein